MDPRLLFLKESLELWLWLVLLVPGLIATRRYFLRRPSR